MSPHHRPISDHGKRVIDALTEYLVSLSSIGRKSDDHTETLPKEFELQSLPPLKNLRGQWSDYHVSRSVDLQGPRWHEGHLALSTKEDNQLTGILRSSSHGYVTQYNVSGTYYGTRPIGTASSKKKSKKKGSPQEERANKKVELQSFLLLTGVHPTITDRPDFLAVFSKAIFQDEFGVCLIGSWMGFDGMRFQTVGSMVLSRKKITSAQLLNRLGNLAEPQFLANSRKVHLIGQAEHGENAAPKVPSEKLEA